MHDYDDNGFGGSQHTSNAFEAAKRDEYKPSIAPLEKRIDEHAEQYNKLRHYLTRAADLHPESSQFYNCATVYGFVSSNSKPLLANRIIGDALILLDAYYKQANQQSI